MKRSRITFLLGIVSLLLSMTSIIFVSIMDSFFIIAIFLFFSLFFSILLIIPAIIGAYFEKLTPGNFLYRGSLLSKSGSTGYRVLFLMFGLFGGYLIFERALLELRLTSPILGIIVLILYILIERILSNLCYLLTY